MVLSGISWPFGQLSQSQGQVTHVLLTRAPLYSTPRRMCFSYDLHVLGTPPAFVLSQDQTLQLNCLYRINVDPTLCYSVVKDRRGRFKPTTLSVVSYTILRLAVKKNFSVASLVPFHFKGSHMYIVDPFSCQAENALNPKKTHSPLGPLAASLPRLTSTVNPSQ